MQSCESAQSTIVTDQQGRSWELFWLGSGRDAAYQFRNMLPDAQSWTRTHPGWVLNDNLYCKWEGTPPPRFREIGPSGEAMQQQPPPPDVPAAEQGMTDGGFGVLVLVAAIAGGAWWFANRNKQPDPDYNPHADLDFALPKLGCPVAAGGADEYMEIPDGAPIPEGYELVPEDEHPKLIGGSSPAAPALPESPAVRGGESCERYPGESVRANSHSPSVSGESLAEQQARIRAELERATAKPQFNITGLTLAEFKTGHCPQGGKFDIEKVLIDPEMADYAAGEVFKFFGEYGSTKLDCCVWWVFGITKQGGNSPSVQKYQAALSFVKQQLDDWKEPF